MTDYKKEFENLNMESLLSVVGGKGRYFRWTIKLPLNCLLNILILFFGNVVENLNLGKL